ncbi:MAG: response regulator [Deltaproteobacteria bacterium]|nr:response regulator [Deltaproteobacteria bacterium]MBN2670719.1 response regulator [Deltaproteobacteria bacterium]
MGADLVMKKEKSEVLRAPAIAIIDDDRDLTRAVARVLRANYNCVVNGFASVEDFLHAVDQNPHVDSPADIADLILLDFHLPGKNGPLLVNELEKRNSPLLTKSRIMGITADSQPVVYAGFKDAGIDEVFLKPLQQIDFGKIADRAYRISRDLDSKAPAPVFKGTI